MRCLGVLWQCWSIDLNPNHKRWSFSYMVKEMKQHKTITGKAPPILSLAPATLSRHSVAVLPDTSQVPSTVSTAFRDDYSTFPRTLSFSWKTFSFSGKTPGKKKSLFFPLERDILNYKAIYSIYMKFYVCVFIYIYIGSIYLVQHVIYNIIYNYIMISI